MTTIIYWTYMADTHCTECAGTAFGAEALDNGTARDGEGNPVHPVFSTDEGRIDEWDKCMSVTCGTCRNAIVESPYDELQITLDGGIGGYSATDYADAIADVVSECGKTLPMTAERRAGLEDQEWQWETLEEVMHDAYTVTGLIFSWHNHGEPGLMFHGTENAWDKWEEDGEEA